MAPYGRKFRGAGHMCVNDLPRVAVYDSRVSNPRPVDRKPVFPFIQTYVPCILKSLCGPGESAAKILRKMNPALCYFLKIRRT